jgi:hypothetical protein
MYREIGIAATPVAIATVQVGQCVQCLSMGASSLTALPKDRFGVEGRYMTNTVRAWKPPSSAPGASGLTIPCSGPQNKTNRQLYEMLMEDPRHADTHLTRIEQHLIRCSCGHDFKNRLYESVNTQLSPDAVREFLRGD